MLQDEFGIDFTHYKPSTVTRRIERQTSTLSQAFDKVLQVFAIVLVPVALGMLVRQRATGFADRMDKPVRIASAERSNMGGGFIEFLFSEGPSQGSRYQQQPAYQPSYEPQRRLLPPRRTRPAWSRSPGTTRRAGAC